MENGKLKMENGKLKMENGKWLLVIDYCPKQYRLNDPSGEHIHDKRHP